MKKPLLLAGILSLTPAFAHANAGVYRAPVGQTAAYNGIYGAVGAAGASAGYHPAFAAGASMLSQGSRGLTLSDVVDSVNAFTAMAFANVKATFFVPGSAEAFKLSDHPDIERAVAALPMPRNERAVPESMRGPARPAGQTGQAGDQPPAVEEIPESSTADNGGPAATVREQLTVVGGTIKKLNVGQVPANLGTLGEEMGEFFENSAARSPS